MMMMMTATIDPAVLAVELHEMAVAKGAAEVVDVDREDEESSRNRDARRSRTRARSEEERSTTTTQSIESSSS